MTEVYKNLYVGNLADYRATKPGDWAYVHATQSVRPKDARGHSDYLMHKNENDLYLSWLDTASYDFEPDGSRLFTKVLDFIQDKLATKKVLVHCDVGESRSPTIALLYLAKRAHTISNESFDSARSDFAKIYPNYYPSGIRIFVRTHWQSIH